MALQHTIALPSGFTLDYWRIIRIFANMNGMSEVILAGYKDQTHRDANSEGYAELRPFAFELPKLAFVEGNVLAQAYEQIKNDLTFQGAITV